MLKRISKKALSLIIALVLVLTSFFVFDPKLLISESSAKIDVDGVALPSEPGVYFYVPEVIYLAANGTAFKYYDDMESVALNDGVCTPKLNSAKNDITGNIFFYYKNATKVKLTQSGAASLTLEGGMTALNTEFNCDSNSVMTANITSGSVASNTSSYITWSATYYDSYDGLWKTVTAKSYVYSPYLGSVAASAQSLSKNSPTMGSARRRYGSISALVFGIHGLEKAASTEDCSAYIGGTQYSLTKNNRGYGTGGYKNGDLPMVNPWYGTPSWGDASDPGFKGDTTGGMVYTRPGGTGNDSAGSQTAVSGIGKLYVDTSRNSDLSGITNLYMRSDFHGFNNSSDIEGFQSYSKYYLVSGDYKSSNTALVTSADWGGFSKTKDQLYSMANNSGSLANADYLILRNFMHFKAKGGQDADLNTIAVVKLYRQDRSALRSALEYATKYNSILNENYFDITSSKWNVYQSALANAQDALTKLDGTADYGTLAAALTNTVNNLVNSVRGQSPRNTTLYSATQNNVALIPQADGSYKVSTIAEAVSKGTDTVTKQYYIHDRISFSPESYSGYTYSRYSQDGTTENGATVSAETFNSFNTGDATVLVKTGYNVNYSYYYIPNTYDVKFDPNGGTFADGSKNVKLFNDAATYGMTYTVAGNGSSPDTPTYPHCEFIGWKNSVDGKIYSPGEAVVWSFANDEGVTFTAQWDYKQYFTFFNENHDGIAANLLSLGNGNDIQFKTTDANEYEYVLNITKPANDTLKLNGRVYGDSIIACFKTENQFKFEAGKTYTMSADFVSGSVTNGRFVIELCDSNGNALGTRIYLDVIDSSVSKTFTVTEKIASSVGGYILRVVPDSEGYVRFDNLTIKPRIEMSNGTSGSGVIAQYLYYGDFYESLPTPFRSGYTFDGWYTDSVSGTKVTAGSATPYEDTTLYAHWIIDKYQLMYENEFNFDEFSFVNSEYPTTSRGAEVDVDYKENSFSFTSAAADDFTRTGQNGTPTSTGYMTLIPGHTYEISYDYTVSKTDEINCYIFAYDSISSTTWASGNQTIDASGSGTTSFTYTVPTGKPYAKLRFGVALAGTALSVKNICVRDLSDPMNYRANDSINPSIERMSDSLEYNANQNPLAEISRPGYTFNGWFLNQNSSNGNGYGTSFTVNSKMPNRDTSIFAQWSLNNYDIVIDLNTGEDDTATIGSFIYRKATNNAATGEISVAGALMAQKADFSGSFTINASYGSTFTLPIPSRTGYTFAGWEANVSPVGSVLTNNGGAAASSYRVGAGTVTLKAVWRGVEYPLNAYAYGNSAESDKLVLGNGGTVQVGTTAAASSVTANVPYKTSAMLIATPAAGYEFVGWYSDAAMTKLISTNAAMTSDTMPMTGLNYYAKFKIKSYTITIRPGSVTKGTTISGWYTAPGIAAESQTIMIPTKITMVHGTFLTLSLPQKTGDTFYGWKITSGTGEIVSSLTANSAFKCVASDATIEAQWSMNQYDVNVSALANSFNASTYAGNGLGGTVQINDYQSTETNTAATVDYNTEFTIKAVAKSGYSFAGWYSDAELTKRISDNPTYTATLGASAVSYYAKFSVNTYDVIVDADNATTGVSASGWYSAPGVVASTVDNIKGRKTIKAVYGSTITLTVPSKVGSDFKGWKITDGNGELTSSITATSTVKCTGNVTVTAQWLADSYNVNVYAYANKFDTSIFSENGLGGTVQINSEVANNKNTSATLGYDTAYTVKAVAGNGYEFAGWYSDALLTSLVSPDATYSTKLGNADVTLYAKFSVKSYNITINADGATSGTKLFGWYQAAGTIAPEIVGVTGEQTITMVYGSALKMTAPTKDGYIFDGWTLTGEGSLNENSFTCANGTATIKANWQADSFDVKVCAYVNKFDSNIYAENTLGGTVSLNSGVSGSSASEKLEYNTEYTVTAVAGEGYVFAGWYSDAALTKLVSDEASFKTKVASSNNALYAKFSVQSYDVTVDADGATVGAMLSGWYSSAGVAADSIENVTGKQTITMVYGSTLTLTSPSKTDCRFDGWFENNAVKLENSTFTCGAENTELKAKWIEDSYIITVVDGKAEEGEAATIEVITKGAVEKVRFTDIYGNTSTISSYALNEDGTKTFSFTKAYCEGEYSFNITAKVNKLWRSEVKTGKFVFTARVYDSGRVISAEFDADTGLYKIVVEGRALKVQFIDLGLNMTRTYKRQHDSVKAIKSYNSMGAEVSSLSRDVDHEVWYIDAKLYTNHVYDIAAKFEAGWNKSESDMQQITAK